MPEIHEQKQGGEARAGRQFLPVGSSGRRETRKASLEGMSEAFRSPAEAGHQGEAAREEERPRSLGAVMRFSPESDKREVGKRAMRKCGGWSIEPHGGTVDGAKKGAPSEDGALRKWWQPDEGGGNAVCHLDLTEGGGSGQIRCRETRDRGRRMRCGVSATRCICGWPGFSAMRRLTCQPCALRKVGQSV